MPCRGVLLGVTIFVNASVAAGQPVQTVDSLRGLEAIGVVVVEFTPLAEQDGLHRVALQADAYSRLRLAGLTIMTGDSVSGPYLHISVRPVKFTFPRPAYLFMPIVELRQNVSTSSGWEGPAVTWSARDFLFITVSPDDETPIGATGGIRYTVGAMLDAFVRDWRTANAR